MAYVYIPEGLLSTLLIRSGNDWKKRGWVKLHSKTLEQMMGRKYAAVVSTLRAADIIRVRRNYIPTVKTRSYRIHDQFKNSPYQRTPLVGKVMNTRVNKYKVEQYEKLGIVQKHLHHWLTHIELPLVDKRYKRQALNIRRIQDKDWFLTDDKYGRVHSNVTNIKCSIRRRLTVNNLQLVEIDISNSQPLMFSLLLLSGFQTTKQSLYPLPSTYICSANHIRLKELSDDTWCYIELCEQGQLYETLMTYLGIDSNDSKARNKFKRDLFKKVLYCCNETQDNALSDAFGELFPNVLKAIKWHKRDDYRELARNMQRAESDLIINKVCGRLMTEHPDCPILTVHDSLLTPEANEDLVKSVLLDEAAKLGIHPSIKVKGHIPRST